MASSEPRITALLDDTVTILSTKVSRPSLQLPPIQASLATRTLERPSPIEPITGANKDVQNSTSRLDVRNSTGKGEGRNKVIESSAEKDVLVPKSPPRNVSPRDVLLNRFGEDEETWSTPPKRQKLETVLPENLTVKLPQLKKKSQPARIAVVPAISDLKTPPPTAARFPRITPSAFEDAHGRHALNGLPAPVSATKTPKKAARKDRPLSKEKESKTIQSTRPRHKWTDAETDDLLQGVALFGAGSWKQILMHPTFNFVNRSAIDLKDRFRTCCPAEYQKSSSRSASSEKASLDDQASSKKLRKPRKTHRREADDLIRLGIEAPFQKTSRRPRHPFTEEEDASLLKGFEIFGPSWSRIQGEPSLNLSTRRATDLRDRFRNRFPQKYTEAGYKSKASSTIFPPSPQPSDPLPSLTMEPSKSDSDLHSSSFEPSSPTMPPSSQSSILTASTSTTMLYTPAEMPSLPSTSTLLDWTGSTFDNNTILPPFTPTFPSNVVSATALGPVVDSTSDNQQLLTHIHPLDTWAAPLPLGTVSGMSSGGGAGAGGGGGGTGKAGRMAWTGKMQTQGMNLPPVGEVVGEFDAGGFAVGMGNLGRKEGGRKEISLSSLMWDDLATQPLFDTEGG